MVESCEIAKGRKKRKKRMTSVRGMVGRNIPTKSRKSIYSQGGKIISQELTKTGKVRKRKHNKRRRRSYSKIGGGVYTKIAK